MRIRAILPVRAVWCSTARAVASVRMRGGPLAGSAGPVAAREPAGASARPTRATAGRLRSFGRRHRTLITVVGALGTAAVLGFVLAGRWDEFSAALSGTPAVGDRRDRAAADRRAGLAQRGVAPEHRGGGRDGRPARPLPRLEHAGAGQPAERAGRRGGADRRAAPLVPGGQPAGADPDRRRVPDPRRRGDAGRADLVHARRPARPAVVAAADRRSR